MAVQMIEAITVVKLSTGGTGTWISHCHCCCCVRQRIAMSTSRTTWTIRAHDKVGVVAAKAKEDKVATTRWASTEEDGDDAHSHPVTGEGHNNQFHAERRTVIRASTIAQGQTTIKVGIGQQGVRGMAEQARRDGQQPALDKVGGETMPRWRRIDHRLPSRRD